MSSLNPYFLLAGRLMLAVIFIVSAFSKITDYAGTQAYMESRGLPGALLPLVILWEVVGVAGVVLGWMTRWAALLLAAFTLVAALFFHTDFADQNQMIHFMKNLAMVGGFLALAAGGPGAFSLDRK